MRPSIARALLVLTVFALLGVLSAADRYVTDIATPPIPPAPRVSGHESPASAFPAKIDPRRGKAATAPERIFLHRFRYYAAWALVAPGILWLGRRVPLRRRQWARPLAFHVIVPVAGSLPFFCLRTLVNAALGAEFPTWTVVMNIPWDRAFALQVVTALPVYWLLLGLGAVLQFSRAYAAHELRAVTLRRSLAAAELDALKMKLQAHFIFNTINTIASLARAGETDAVVRVVERLGTLLRLSMETGGRQFVMLGEELALLDAYLAIEEVRFEDRLRIVRRIAPEARTALVPNLILQPLVDNALVHGLKNVIERLDRLFPGAWSFTLTNAHCGGAIARMRIPWQESRR